MPQSTLPQLTKLRVKLAAHEFEAEGPPEVVAAHFQTWQDLIAAFPLAEPGGPPAAAQQPTGTSGRRPGGLLNNVFAVDPQRKLVTLRRYPGGKAPHADAALLLIYGFHHSLGEQGRGVEVTRLKAALSASGHPGARISRTLERYRGAGLVKKHGRRKGSTYELTPRGSERAAALAQAFGTRVAPAT